MTFLFTRIAESTRHWEEDPTAKAEALRSDDAVEIFGHIDPNECEVGRA